VALSDGDGNRVYTALYLPIALFPKSSKEVLPPWIVISTMLIYSGAARVIYFLHFLFIKMKWIRHNDFMASQTAPADWPWHYPTDFILIYSGL
jgi:hypothetical protein